jgi:hypothetical protein
VLKFLMNLMNFLPRRLQAIIDGEGNSTKYFLKVITNGPFSRPKLNQKEIY